MDSQRSQQGAVLFIALIILLIVSFMGVSAMRGGILSERMAFSSQAREMSFQAAETAINGVLSQARTSDTLLNDLLGSLAIRSHCVTSDELMVDGVCAATDAFDERQVLQGRASSRFDRKRVAFNNDASTIADYQFVTTGSGSFIDSLNLPFESHNEQQWRKLGPANGPFEVSDPTLIGRAPPQP